MQPLLYAAIALAGGIAAAAAGPPWLAPLAAPWILLSLLVGLAAAARRRPLAAALGLTLCFCAGYGRARWVVTHPPPPSALAALAARWQPKPHDRLWLAGYLRDTPQLLFQDGRPSALRLDVEANSLARDPQAEVEPVRGGVRFYAYPPRPRTAAAATAADDFPDTPPPPAADGWAAGLLRLRAGDGIALTAHLRPLPAYRDPGVADFSATARREGIELTASVVTWRTWPMERGPRLARLRAALWRGLSQRLDQLAPPARNPRFNGLLRGMLLGDVARLDQATRTAFQIDGVYHLVVVAGLHIGVLAVFLLFVFRRCRLPPLYAGTLVLIVLAAYAWTIAGRTPTVRALFMLTLYLGASWWYRERQALNAVGFAALALLLWRPLDLFTPGFQMSLGAAALLAGVALPLLLSSSRRWLRACSRLDEVAYDQAFSPRLAQWRLDLRALATRLGWISHPLGWRLMPALLRGFLHIFEVMVISLVLQFGFAAFNAVYFHRANPWSVIANAVLVPAAGVLIPLAWAGLAIGPLASGVVVGMGHAMLWIADTLARWPGAGLRVPSPPGWFLVAFGVAVAAWLAAFRFEATWRCHEPSGHPLPIIEAPPPSDHRERPKQKLAVPGGRRAAAPALASALMAALTLALALSPFPPRLPPGLTATVLDVGQGDSIFVSFPDGRTLLVDGGPRSPHWDSGDEILAPFLWSLGLRRLDAVLLTHGHNDHLGGLATVVADFHPGEVWVTRTLPSEAPVAAFLREVKNSGARLRRLDAGDVFLAGATRLQILLPPPAYQAGALASNDDSLVVRLSLGDNSMLLEGDAESGGERWMVDQHLPLASTLLKVGHHGSKTSTSPEFLAAVHPRVAIISDGRGNSYGHPAPAVVARLQQAGVRVFRTDQDGAVQCRLLPHALEVWLFRPLP